MFSRHRLGLLCILFLGLHAGSQEVNLPEQARAIWNDYANKANEWAKYHQEHVETDTQVDATDHRLYHEMRVLQSRSNKIWEKLGYK